MPFQCATISINKIGSRLNYLESHFETMEPYNGFEPNIVQNFYVVNIMLLCMKHVLIWLVHLS